MGECVSPDVFVCKKCGQCCEGRGGIVLSDKDIARLASFLGISGNRLVKEYAEISGGKLKIKTGLDGFCVFFEAGKGCAAHDGKPDVCRAWPFFRGNLEDRASFEMAREYCPGIGRSVEFEKFVARGLDYLCAAGLLASGGSREANALDCCFLIGNHLEKN